MLLLIHCVTGCLSQGVRPHADDPRCGTDGEPFGGDDVQFRIAVLQIRGALADAALIGGAEEVDLLAGKIIALDERGDDLRADELPDGVSDEDLIVLIEVLHLALDLRTEIGILHLQDHTALGAHPVQIHILIFLGRLDLKEVRADGLRQHLAHFQGLAVGGKACYQCLTHNGILPLFQDAGGAGVFSHVHYIRIRDRMQGGRREIDILPCLKTRDSICDALHHEGHHLSGRNSSLWL